jgi:DNA-binding NtrC family response regulator
VVPLRERREDIEALALHFFAKFSSEKEPAREGLQPGGDRGHGGVLVARQRARDDQPAAPGDDPRRGALHRPADLGLEAPATHLAGNGLDDARWQAERMAIASTLQHTGRNVAVSARRLGVSRMTLYRLMDKHGL